MWRSSYSYADLIRKTFGGWQRQGRPAGQGAKRLREFWVFFAGKRGGATAKGQEDSKGGLWSQSYGDFDGRTQMMSEYDVYKYYLRNFDL